ncbi:MAG: phosphatidate cytidylyltransferase [Bacteroidetes bacterium]|nr:phosphatidate cytidylyltransferase [Bacteroidota bacterium]
MAFNVKTFYIRATTALVFAALLLGCVWYSYPSFFLFFGIIGAIGLFEFCKISKKLEAQPSYYAVLLLHIFTTFTVLFYTWYPNNMVASTFFVQIFFLLFFSLFIVELFKEKAHLSSLAYTALAWLYTSLPCALLLLMGVDAHYNFVPHKILGMIFFVWINDTGAYLVGSFIGKHKLFARISPNKTWEGTLGGIAFCIGLSYVVYLLFPQLAYKHWLMVSLIVAVMGTLGDLVESMLKRLAGVKDSGSLMPGHGGVLDRFDSLFFASPFVYVYFSWMGVL